MLKQIARSVWRRPWLLGLALEGGLALALLGLGAHLLLTRHSPPAASVESRPLPLPALSPSPALSPVPRNLTPSPPRGSSSSRPASAAPPSDLLDRMNQDARSRYVAEWAILRNLTRAIERYLIERVVPRTSKREGTDASTAAAHR